MEETVQILRAVTCYYPNFTVSENLIKEWFLILKKYDYQFVRKNLENYVTENRFPPVIADLVQQREQDKKAAYSITSEETLDEKSKRAEDDLKKLGLL